MSIGAEITASIESFKINEANLQELLTGVDGPVAREIARRAIKVESTAKGYASGSGGGPNVRTGRLRGSITWRLGKDSSVYADVGSAVEYAIYVEMGTSRMSARPYLRPSLAAAR